MTCGTCLKTKLRRAPHKRKEHNYMPGEAFCSDILGPIRPPQQAVGQDAAKHAGQELYFISFVDVATRYAYVTPIRSRDKTAQIIDRFLNNFATRWGRAPKWLITDTAGEYTSKVVLEILGDMDIEHVPTVAYNPKENGIAERINLTLMNEVRAALETAKLSCHYWTFALAEVVDKYNQLPHSATGKSPHEAWFGTKADLRALYIFGQTGFVPIMVLPKRKQPDRGNEHCTSEGTAVRI